MSHHVFSHNEDAKFIKPRRPHNTKDVSLKASSLKEFMGYLLIFFEKYKKRLFQEQATRLLLLEQEDGTMLLGISV